MSKNIFIFLLLNFFVAENLFAQHRGDNWCFSDSCGISFLSGNPTNFQSNLCTLVQSFSGFPTQTSASISDEQGNLLFYANGNKVWNAIGDTLVTNLPGLGCGQDAGSGCLFLPYPAREDSIIAYFYVWSFPAYHPQGLYCTQLNTNLNGGLGEIIDSTIYQPVFLTDSVSKQLTAIKHANGRDWWLIFKTGNRPDYFKVLFGPNGVELVDSQEVGLHVNLWSTGEICSNLQGDLIASCHWQSRQIEIMSFDRCSGQMSLIYSKQFNTNNGPMPFGCSFSTNDRNFYYSIRDTIYQIHINPNLSVDPQTIIASEPFTVFPPTDSIYAYGGHELAPDGKIYIVCGKESTPYLNYTYRDKNLCVINNPNGIGAACDFQPWSYYLGGKKITIGLPNMPNYNLGSLEGSTCDTLTSIQNKNLKTKNIVSVFPNPSTNTINISSSTLSGKYSLKIYNLLGQQVKQQEIDFSFEGSSKVNIESLASGYYQLMLVNGSNVVSKRFVKE